MLYPHTGAFARPASKVEGDFNDSWQGPQEGIDVRTYIATAALQGLLADPELFRDNESLVARGEHYAAAAYSATRYADALIAELNK